SSMRISCDTRSGTAGALVLMEDAFSLKPRVKDDEFSLEPRAKDDGFSLTPRFSGVDRDSDRAETVSTVSPALPPIAACARSRGLGLAKPLKRFSAALSMLTPR